MSIENYIKELEMFLEDSRYEKLHGLINSILSLQVHGDKLVNLYNEVVYLKERLLLDKAHASGDHIDDHEKRIDILESQVNHLRKENAIVLKENAELKIEIDELRLEFRRVLKENADLKIEIDELRIDLKRVLKDNAHLKLERLMNKMVTALQDLNASEKLEMHFNKPINQIFYAIRMSRNTINHYLKLDGHIIDSQDLIEYKKFMLYQIITSIPDDAKEWLEDEYGEGLIESTIQYLKDIVKPDVEVSEKEKRMVKRWWGLI